MNSEMFSETIDSQIDSAVTTTAVIADDETTTVELFTRVNSKSVVVEVEPGKALNINPNLSTVETRRVMKLLNEHKEALSWDYMDMKGIPYELCTHHMNPNLREIVKEELQKLLNARFIYPI
jgi:hypothetical protein